MKRCEICGREKPEEDFSKSYRNRCKECVAEMVRNVRASGKYRVSRGTEIISVPQSEICDRPMMATIILQGLLSSGYFPESRSLPAMAVSLTDELIEELSKEGSKP